MAINYRQHDCYKCRNEKCNDDFSQFIPSFDTAFAGLIECENFKPAITNQGGADENQ